MHRSSSKLTFLTLLVATLAAASAQTPSVQKVATPPPLTPLAMTIGGRVLHASGTSDYVSQWPGVYFQAAFKGPQLFFTLGPSQEILHLIVDAQPPIVLTSPTPGTYSLTGLTAGPHTVSLQIASESQSAPNHFGGFALASDSSPLPPPTPPSRQIEFIGDSQTVGFGNASPKHDCTPAELTAATDNTLAFGPLIAAHFHAAYQINASSGRGIIRNYNGFPADTVPVSYPYTLFDKQQLYNDPTWHPQVIVISLGTNDFTTPLNPGEKWKTRDQLHTDYEATYLRFLHTLRARNPHTGFILWATDLANGEIASEVQKVVDQARSHGETRIAFLPIDHLAFTGCMFHPSLIDDQTIATDLIHQIDSIPGVWQGKP
jgi:lysophospholipase L1-like esterase